MDQEAKKSNCELKLSGHKDLYKPCLRPGCDKYGVRQGYCLSHYITDVYRKRPAVKERLRLSNRDRRSRWNRSKHYADRHGVPWEISFEQFEVLVQTPCHYCGASLRNETGRGLDRIDNLKGYTSDNVLPCCGRCNRLRGHVFEPDEVKVMMTAVAEYRSRKTA